MESVAPVPLGEIGIKYNCWIMLLSKEHLLECRSFNSYFKIVPQPNGFAQLKQLFMWTFQNPLLHTFNGVLFLTVNLGEIGIQTF